MEQARPIIRKPVCVAPAIAWLAFIVLWCAGPARANDSSWEFAGPAPAAGARWTAERGRIEWDQGAARLHPDKNGRVVLVSPAGLTQATGSMKVFALDLSATGLLRVRVQGRRDARGGWITLADASGPAIRQLDDRVVIGRKTGIADGPIDQLRIELSFRTTGVRGLTRITVRAD